MKPKNIFTIILILIVIMSNSVFAIENYQQSEGLNKSDYFNKDNYEVRDKEIFKLLEKYELEVLSTDEVKELGLDKIEFNELSISHTIDEIEHFIIQQLDILKNGITEEYNIYLDIETESSYESNTSEVQIMNTETRYATVIRSHTYTPKTDMTIRLQVAATYQYDYFRYPIGSEPPIISNEKWVSVGGGEIMQISSPGYNRLTTIKTNVVNIISDRALRHEYEYDYDSYIGIPTRFGNLYVKTGSGTTNGHINYFI